MYNRPPAPLPFGHSSSVMSDFTDLLQHPIGSDQPSSLFASRPHAVAPKGCNGVGSPIHTNNFYNNLTLEDQTCPVWTLPYSLWISRDAAQGDVGLAFNHTEAAQRVFGPEPNANPVQFYFNPPRIKSWVFSSINMDASQDVVLANHQKLSVVAKWNGISFPLVHGMGFVTAVYDHGRVPVVASLVGIQTFDRVLDGKYRATLFNQVVWTIYVSQSNVELSLESPQRIVGSSDSGCVVQICRGESSFYDDTAGVYPVACHLGCSVFSNGSAGQYKFSYELAGQARNGRSDKTVVWCLPHHQEVLAVDGQNTIGTGLELDSPTKGVMKAYVTNELLMTEPRLPVDIQFEPWTQLGRCPGLNPPDAAKVLIRAAAQEEVKQDVEGMSDIDSMYTSGKILGKYAHILYVCSEILKDEALVNELFPKLERAIDRFAQNQQKYPLVYDTRWKGLISSADPGADFGNSNYNDHHFHYGYHIHAVALVAKAKPGYLDLDSGKRAREYVATLIRDTANPSTSDTYFPQFRSFDWFHGHSFAHGIFALGDGKDEESSSEDYHFAYGMKLFGIVTGDKSMESRADLMLAIMRRAMNMYMLYSDDNKIQPPQFIKNKVAGISFENKIDFATYFGRGTIGDEWIHGIHMLPITPVSSYIRGPQFVREEWDQKLAAIIDQIPDGWKGILMLNLALCDPKAAWRWFARNDWDNAQIDNGMSRTWSLAYIAGVGGSE